MTPPFTNSSQCISSRTHGGILVDVLIVIGIIVLLWFLWVASGGPQHFNTKRSLLLDSSKTEDSTSTQQTPSSTGNTSSDTKTPSSKQTPSSTEPSPYASYVSISVNDPGGDAHSEYVTLLVSPNAPSPISITGWTLTSGTLHKSVAVESGSITPLRGQITATQAITLTPGQRAILLTGRSPIGVSFLSNICSGYLNENQQFMPPFPISCPSATDSARTYGVSDNDCLAYLSIIPRCTDGTTFLANAPSSICAGFIEQKISYNGCVATYENRPRFSTGQWRVYFGRMFPLWWRNDTITLRDADGRTVTSTSF